MCWELSCEFATEKKGAKSCTPKWLPGVSFFSPKLNMLVDFTKQTPKK